ncbi:MAG: Do family serine endopeptidase [Elusimicrobiota bacterium]
MDKKVFFMLVIILIGGILLGTYADRLSNTGPIPCFSKKDDSGKDPQLLMSSFQDSFTSVVEHCRPSLVNISAVRMVEVPTPFHKFYFGDPLDEFFGGIFGRPKRKEFPEQETEEFKHEGTGSGFIVDPAGYILTNYHVIKGAEEIEVTTYDDKKYDALLIGRDAKTDLAVVKINSPGRFNALSMGDSDKVKIGSWVVAAGSPFGLQQTFTAGIVSAVRQDVHIENTTYRDMLQTDASINRGNSGGPLLDLTGSVIGINTAVFGPTGVFTGIGFAIPINQAKKILGELMEKGTVIRGWLGAAIMDVDDILKSSFGLNDTKGALVNMVLEGSPAESGGLKRGDVIISVDGKIIENSRELQDVVSSKKPGSEAVMEVVREGKTSILKIELGTMPVEDEAVPAEKKKKNKSGEIRCRGIGVTELTPDIREYYGITVPAGVIVTDIDPAGECFDSGLMVGDIIIGIDNIKLEKAGDFENALKKLNLKKGIVFDVIRNGRPMYLSYQKSR